MAQCSNFVKFFNPEGFCRFGSHDSIYEFQRCRVNFPWSKCLPLKKTTLKRTKYCSVKFVFAIHGQKKISCHAEDSTFSSFEVEQADAIHERERLKEKLCSRLDSTRGLVDNEADELILSLNKLNPYPDITSCHKELYAGCFEGVKASYKGTGKKGEAQKELAASDTLVTLGRASFNSFKPQDLEIRLKQTYNHVAQGSEDAYSIIIVFSTETSPSLAPLEGLLINRATFRISNPGRMEVVFVSSTLAPRYPERDLDRWLNLFKAANPDMDEKGSVTLSLPKAKGWLDYLYLDEDIRITKGNRGGVFVVRRMQRPAVSV